MITRKRKRKPTSAEELDAALDALPRRGEPRPMPETWDEFARNNLVDEHERLARALKKSMAGIMRKGGKEQPDTKTLRGRTKYAPLIVECDRRRVPLGKPHTQERLDAVMVVAVEVNPSLTRGAVLKHLQRHYK